MVEIRREASRYADSHPYEAVRVQQSSDLPDSWLYALRMTRRPDPMLAIILGEFIHNLRSALDNIVVASSPPKYRYTASFPISLDDVLALNDLDSFQFKADDAGQRFAKALAGLPVKAQALVERVQPYRIYATRETHSLGMLSRLDNADKHRGAIALGAGLRNATVKVRIKGDERLHERLSPTRHQFIDDGAKLVSFDSTSLLASDVDVEVHGTACVTVKVTLSTDSDAPADFRIQSALWKPLTDVRWVIRKMTPFVL